MMKDFKKHSSINGKHIKFMCQNNNSDEISTYNKPDLANLETKTNTMKTDFNLKIKTVTATAESSRKIGVNIGNRVKTVEETIKKLATKAEVGSSRPWCLSRLNLLSLILFSLPLRQQGHSNWRSSIRTTHRATD